MKITGLDDLNDQLSNLERRVKKLSGTHQISLDQLLTPKFMTQNTKFKNFTDFFNEVDVHSESEFKKLSQSKLDNLVKNTTIFSSWNDMLQRATTEYFRNLI